MSKRHRRRYRDRWERQYERGTSVFESLNPHRLRRSTRRGRILGVCAGLADYFGIRRSLVRVGAVVGLIFFPWAVGLVYLALAFILPRQTEVQPEPAEMQPEAREDASFWRGVAVKPADTFSALRFRFRELEDRLASLETEVTHPDSDLKRQFRDLG
jgi:phage shock protein C